MSALARLRQALRGVSRFRRRSALMMLGIAVGIAALTVLDSIGEATRRETLQRVKNMLGTFDTILIRPGGGKARGMVSLTNVEPVLKFDDASAIAAQVPEVKQVAELQNAFDLDVTYRDHQATPAVFGVSSNWLELRGDQLALGQFFTADEVRSLARKAVLGPEAKSALFPGEDPLGKTLRIGGVPFEVIGVLVSRGAGPVGSSLDNLVLIPVSTASKRLFNRDFLTMIIAQLKDPEQGDLLVRKLTVLLRERHHLAPAALDDFNLTSPKAVVAQLTSVVTTLGRILSGVALLSMLVGGFVIMGLMTAGVNERTQEIGVRRSVGASRADIVLQFLLEALLVALGGGALGVGLGLAVATLVAVLQKTQPSIAAGAILTWFSLSAAVGLVFGSYPAWRASRVDPVAALRA